MSSISPKVDEAQQAILAGELTWALFEPVQGNTQISLSVSGTSDLDDFVQEFQESKIQFGLIRIVDSISKLTKIILISWVSVLFLI